MGLDREEKPWGNYQVFIKGDDFQVKRLEIAPGARFSLQKHLKRAEKWIVVSGSGTARGGARESAVKRGSVLEVPLGELHRLHNTGKKPLVVIEVQFGGYLGEDDVIRL